MQQTKSRFSDAAQHYENMSMQFSEVVKFENFMLKNFDIFNNFD